MGATHARGSVGLRQWLAHATFIPPDKYATPAAKPSVFMHSESPNRLPAGLRIVLFSKQHLSAEESVKRDPKPRVLPLYKLVLGTAFTVVAASLDILYKKLLRHQRSVAHYYLTTLVFPQLMKFQLEKVGARIARPLVNQCVRSRMDARR